MTSLLPAVRREKTPPAEIVSEVPIKCDRDERCPDLGHPWHLVVVRLMPVRVADLRFVVSVTVAGERARSWFFTDRTEALTKHCELTAAFRRFVAASEQLAGAQ